MNPKDNECHDVSKLLIYANVKNSRIFLKIFQIFEITNKVTKSQNSIKIEIFEQK